MRISMLIVKVSPGAHDLPAAEAEEQYPLSGRMAIAVPRCDADDRIAPIPEVFHGADYVWLPIEQALAGQRA